MVFVAGRAAIEVRPHVRDLPAGAGEGEFQLDIVIQLVEALLAGQLWGCRAEESRQ